MIYGGCNCGNCHITILPNGDIYACRRVQILGYTKYKEMIRLSAKAYPVAEEEQEKWIETIFEEQPYLANVYPGETRKNGIVFAIKEGTAEYFNLGVHPIFRESYSLGERVSDFRTLYRLWNLPEALSAGMHRSG